MLPIDLSLLHRAWHGSMKSKVWMARGQKVDCQKEGWLNPHLVLASCHGALPVGSNNSTSQKDGLHEPKT